jgi:hypothetical protein
MAAPPAALSPALLDSANPKNKRTFHNRMQATITDKLPADRLLAPSIWEKRYFFNP